MRTGALSAGVRSIAGAGGMLQNGSAMADDIFAQRNFLGMHAGAVGAVQ